MLFFVALAILSATSEGCELPEQLSGHWDSSLPGWQDLAISNTTISDIKPKGLPLPFTCHLNNGTRYVLRSPLQHLNAQLKYHYFICLDIVPSEASPYVVFFRILTEKNEFMNNRPFQMIVTTTNETLDGICNIPPTELPLDFSYFLRKDFKEVMVEACPGSLHGMFAANFTNETDYRKCPEGFQLDGCDHSHLAFNYSGCGGGAQGYGASGSVNYTCLTSVEKDDVLYTVAVLETSTQGNPYEFTCLAMPKDDQGNVTITKSPGTCGATPPVLMEAEETVSCRSEAPSTSEAPTTPAGSMINTTQAFNSTTTQGTGTGEGGEGGGGCTTASMGYISFLLPILTILLAALEI